MHSQPVSLHWTFNGPILTTYNIITIMFGFRRQVKTSLNHGYHGNNSRLAHHPRCRSSVNNSPAGSAFVAKAGTRGRMEHTNLVQRGNMLQVQYDLVNMASNTTPFLTNTGPEHVINKLVKFQVMSIVSGNWYNGYKYKNFIFIKFSKLYKDDDPEHAVTFTSEELGLTKMCFTCDNDMWQYVYTNDKQKFTFNVTVYVTKVQRASFSCLHEDIDLTDFKLRGEDGSVHLHRVVLAASSPFFMRMFKGAWQETTEGYVDVPGTSKITLQHLKNYVYLQTLPDTGLEQLLLLSSYYMMTDLEQACVYKLISNITAESAGDLLEFSMKNKIKSLMVAVLDSIQRHEVDVKDIPHYLSPST